MPGEGTTAVDTAKNQDYILRAVAVILVALFVAGFAMQTDAHLLWKLDHISPTDYIAAQRHQFQQPYSHKFFVYLVFGALMIGGTEFFTSVLRLLLRRKVSA